MAAALVLTASFRFLAMNGFSNDHFLHLAGAQQMLFGDWPTRDFADPGLPLMYGASALAQVLLGHTLFAEAVLVSVAFGLAAALTALAALELTSSVVLALVATGLEVAIVPRTYGYPKVLLYAAGFLLFLQYVRAPGTWRLVAVAAGAAAAFLFRHDHGLYLALGGALAIALTPAPRWQDSARRTALFAGVVALLLAPYLLYVQAYGGLWTYVRTGMEFSAREFQRQGRLWPSPFGGDAEPTQVFALYLFQVIPLAAAAVVLARWRGGGARSVAARVLPVAVVAVLVNASFLRDPLNTRLADAIAPAALLGVWLVSRAWSVTRLRAAWVSISAAVLLAAGYSVAVIGNTAEEFDRMGLGGDWSRLPARVQAQTADLRERFSARQMPTAVAAGVKPFIEYLDRCTLASDRLLLAGFLPEVAYFARRPFAGGQSTFVDGYYGSGEDQRRVVERLGRQSVPFMLSREEDAAEFDAAFPIVAGYVRSRYHPMAKVPVDQETVVVIQVDAGLTPAGVDARTGWPCFLPR